jgi:diguanylate cyclase (GGDEF)-like protein
MPRVNVRVSRPPDVESIGPCALIVDLDDSVRAQLARLARAKLLAVIAVANPAEALTEARRTHFDVAVVGTSLDSAALVLARELRETPGHDRLPLAFLSAENDIERRIAAAHAGASLFLPKPVDPYAFGAALDQMLALGHADRMRVLVVDDDSDFVAVATAVLARDGIAVHASSDARALVDLLDDVRPDLLLLDAMMPGVSGWDAIRIVRTMPEYRDMPILFLTARTDVESRVAAFNAGADDYLAKPLVAEELLARVRVRLDRLRLLREITDRDSLTRCMSRRALLDAFASRLSEIRRHSLSLSLALLDVDRFKLVNDTYGHLVGDHVLATLGRLLNSRFRLEDLRGRWGGEEFVIVFPGEPPETATAVLSRVLDEFRGQHFLGERGERFSATFSAGISSYPDDGENVDALLRAADERLYAAKRRGRGQVVGA